MTDNTEEIRRAEQNMESALTRLKNAKAGKLNSGLEAIYGQAYQRLVRAGAKPQLKLKYRG
jgi:flagellin-specific chaperone FliS